MSNAVQNRQSNNSKNQQGQTADFGADGSLDPMTGVPGQSDFGTNVFGPVPTFGPAGGAVSAIGPVSAVSSSTTATPTSTSGSSAPTISSSVVGSGDAPSWVSGLTTASIKTDMAAADVNGTVSYAGLEKVFADLQATLASAGSTVTSAEMADLKTIASNLNSGMSTSSYLTGVTGALVNGNASNAKWTGGAASSTNLGNLATGSSATQLNELIGKWFLGTDLPSSSVAMTGESTFSISYSTSSSPLFGSSGPSMSDVNQGQLGDCYLLSSLAEVAKQNSGDISSMITSNGNGTYGVRFYENGQAQYVTVNSSLADGGRIFNSGSDSWASLVEKAYTQLQGSGVVTGNSINDGNSYSTIGNGGQPFYALEEITGASQINYFGSNGSSGTWADWTMNSSLQTTAYSASGTTSSLLSTLQADLAKGDDVILSSNTNATDSSGKQTLVADHAMSIYGYDSATNMLEVRNPWGSESGQYWDTTFEVSLSTLQAAGDGISVDNIGSNAAASAPTVTNQTATQTWKLGQAVSFALPTNTFTDPQGQKLTYTATQANGSALPSWLTFNASTGTFTGTVPNTAAGLSLKVTATDTSGLSVTETFSVSTPATAPTIANQTATQTWKLGQAVSFALPTNTFTDPQGQKLTYTATQANGSALPSWLTFNASTGTFTGTVPNTAAGLSLKVTATDTSGLSVTETFSVSTPATAPTIANQTAAQTWKLGQAVSFALPTNTFADPQGEKLTYTATQANGSALPSWLTFNASTGTFTGTVPNTTAGLSLKVTATDTSGLTVSETFSVSTPATAPTVANQTAAQTWKLGQAVSFALPTNTFADPQGEKLTYTATQANGSALPSWLTFNASTGTFTGTVPNTAAGLSLKVTATDTSGLSVTETFSVSTPATAPTLKTQTAAQTWKLGQAVNFELPSTTFSDPQGEKLTYTATLANGAALPSWLTFNASTGTFTGTVPNTAAGLSLKVTATDTSGLTVSETFSVSTPATAPTLANQTAAQTWKLGQAVSFALPTNTFTDPQGEKLTYTATQANGSALPSWLTFNSSTGTFAGTVPNTAAGLSLKVTATDTSGLTVSETFSVSTPATAPTLANQTAAQTWKLGQAVSFALPTNTFTDPQGEKLTYTATQANGAALPSWLTFNASTNSFTGTVPSTATGMSLKVTATDTSGLSVSETIGVSTVAAAPTVSSLTKAQGLTEGKAFSLVLPTNTFTDPQGEKLTYTATQATGSALPSWLTFNAATETFSGTAPSTASSLNLKVTATDTSGLQVAETFTAVVNTASLLAQAIAAAPASAAVTSSITQLVSAPPSTLAPSH